MDNEQNIGYLIVNVSTARGAIPLSGASVTVFDNSAEGNPLVTVVSTDTSGKTTRIALPTPDRSESKSPGTKKPFATYMVQVSHEGYYTVTNNGVPVFEGVTSIQPVEMIPLADKDSENVYPRGSLEIDETEPQNL